MLKEGYYMSSTEAKGELEDVKTNLRKKDEEVCFVFNYYYFLFCY